MTAVFAFAAIVGWPLLLFLFFGGEGGEADVDIDAVDVDVDLDVESGAGAGVASAILSLLSFRSLVFFLAFFGATGLILTALSAVPVVALVVAVLVGLFSASFNTRVFRYLKSSSVGTEISDRALSGSMAQVTVPVSAVSRGRVTCRIDGQTINLTAVPFDAHEQSEFGVGETVVVVEVDRGVARVSSMREFS